MANWDKLNKELCETYATLTDEQWNEWHKECRKQMKKNMKKKPRKKKY